MALKQLRTLTNATLVLNTAQACYVFAHHIPYPWQNAISHPGFHVNNHYVFAAHHAFVSGFLYGWLQKHALEKCSEFAMACQAIVQARQDISASHPSLDELLMYLSDQNHIVPAIKTPHFSHIHYASTRPPSDEPLFTFSFGYHYQWQKIASTMLADEATIHQVKFLIAQGLKNSANASTSIISDDNFQPELLELCSGHRFIRSLESPGEVPLRCNGEVDLTQSLLQWPKAHSAKVTVIYHPDDRYALRGQQETILNHFYRTCRATQHELFIELAPPTNSFMTASTISHIMRRFYEIGIYPDGWHITPPEINAVGIASSARLQKMIVTAVVS